MQCCGQDLTGRGVAGELVGAVQRWVAVALFGGRDGSGRRIDGLRGGERQEKVASQACAASYRAARRRQRRMSRPAPGREQRRGSWGRGAGPREEERRRKKKGREKERKKIRKKKVEKKIGKKKIEKK
jgi:hypothetical protein